MGVFPTRATTVVLAVGAGGGGRGVLVAAGALTGAGADAGGFTATGVLAVVGLAGATGGASTAKRRELRPTEISKAERMDFMEAPNFGFGFETARLVICIILQEHNQNQQ